MSTQIEWLSVKDFCALAGISRSAYDRWKTKGTLPPHRIFPGGQVKFHPAHGQP